VSAQVGTRWPWWAETVLVVAVTALSAQDAYISAGGRLADVAVVVAVVAGVVLIGRRRWPLPVAALATAAAGGWGLVFPLLVVLFHLTGRGRLKVAAGCAVLALVANRLVHPPLSLWATRSYGPVLLLVLAIALGLWAANRRRLLATVATQVDQPRTERALREEGARLAERAAIAAEMHDVLAHRLSLIALHTGALQTRTTTLPEQIGDRIALLRTASTDALADLRDILGALRDPDRDSRRAPSPALREVDELIEQATAAGQHVAATIDGRPEQVPAADQLAVVRLVQETLTNARKHAPGAPVTLRVHYGPPATTVEVTNTAALPPAPDSASVPSGFGLIGLAERVHALGGALEAGPAGDGCWRVAAHLPAPTDESRTQP